MQKIKQRGWGAAVLLMGIGLCAIKTHAQDSHNNEKAPRKIVVFDAQTDAKTRKQIVENAGGEVVQELPLINAVAAVFPPKSTFQILSQLSSGQNRVVRIDEDLIYHLYEPLPATPQQIPWGINRVNAPSAWARSKGSKVRVAIVDTGIDPRNPDLVGNMGPGFNAIAGAPSWNWADDHGHGTHVAGTVAAVNDKKGVAGVAPKAWLYGVKVLNADGSGYWSDIAKGIEWCIKNKIQVINMSLGGSSGNESVHETIANAVKAGVTIVAAAGNSGYRVGYPAAYPEAIAVSASNSKDQIAYFSSRGPEVDFIAPGVDVLSTVPTGSCGLCDASGYKSLRGTSMAAPHMTGLAALAIAYMRNSNPQRVRQALETAAEPLAGLSRNEQGFGLVNAARLVGLRNSLLNDLPSINHAVEAKKMEKFREEAKVLGIALQETEPVRAP
ncbi:MAG: S8 family peptidase [Elusimicrobia bacterium]|nr:S8 family peptidase [Elusimicrobiota bacterium]